MRFRILKITGQKYADECVSLIIAIDMTQRLVHFSGPELEQAEIPGCCWSRLRGALAFGFFVGDNGLRKAVGFRHVRVEMDRRVHVI